MGRSEAEPVETSVTETTPPASATTRASADARESKDSATHRTDRLCNRNDSCTSEAFRGVSR